MRLIKVSARPQANGLKARGGRAKALAGVVGNLKV
jgi:hypothetical protein